MIVYGIRKVKFMHAGAMCISCILSKEEKSIRQFSDEEKKSEYIHRVLEILYKYGQTESSPGLTEKLGQLYQDFWGSVKDYTAQKQKYNQLLLNMEEKIAQQIKKAFDPMKECIKYVCAANYIDFSAVDDVNEATLEGLLQKAVTKNMPEDEYERFREDLQNARSLVYLTDNCGEIVLDKLFIQYIKESFKKLSITVIVRGGNVINDATMEDAEEVGLTKLAPCMGNGNAAPGTIVSRLSEEARTVIYGADLIISKGQGNFESLYGEQLNPYYLFLCKCELFVQRFGLAQYESVFVREARMGKCLYIPS